MTTHAETADLQGGVLKSLVVDWLAGTAEISIDHTPSPEQIKRLALRFSGLARLIVPREGEWRGEMGVARIYGPITLEHDRQHLRIEMQSGDVIELDYVSLVAEPATDFAQPSVSPEPEHPIIQKFPTYTMPRCGTSGCAGPMAPRRSSSGR